MGIQVQEEYYAPQYDAYIFYRCPTCRELFYTVKVDPYGERSIAEERYPHAWLLKYCPACGQELIWKRRRR